MEQRRVGKYLLKRELGKGGMASVYLATDTELDRLVAIKLLHPLIADRPEGKKRFHREARAAARLKHPNVIEVYDYSAGRDDEPPYLVYEYVNGPNLAAFIRNHAPPWPEIVAAAGVALAHGLGAAHKEGIIHRDVKPENVLVDRSGRLVVTDFGIARLMGDKTMTATGAVMGSPAYMSPEQARGERLDQRSDLFSLGGLLYHMATGRPPFAGKTPVAVMSAVLQGTYTPPIQARGDLGPDLDRVLQRCLAQDPDQRYQTADDLANDLEHIARLGGLTDQDQELAAYLRAPETRQEELRAPIIDACVARAQAAKQPAKVLALADRILAVDPQNTAAQRLVDRLTARKRWHVAAAGLAVSLAVAMATWAGMILMARHRPSDTTMTVAQVAADAQTDASETDATASPQQDAETIGQDARPAPTPPTKHHGSRKHNRQPTASPKVDASVPRTVPRPTPRPDAATPPPQRPGAIVLAIKPWCQASIDGRSVGRSPSGRAIPVPAGRHHVTCRQGTNGPSFSRWVQIRAGQSVHVRGSVLGPCQVTVPKSSASTTWTIDGLFHRPGRYRIPAGRHKVVLLDKGVPVRTNWILFPPGGRCTLKRGSPLSCR
ncbi:MAG: protein kinase [Deltaproteobacteria bacterium]|nr:protein kinase [Deltaproteobacteria bacterium]